MSGFSNPFNPQVAPTNGYGMRNRIVNGDMRIDQANAGAAAVVSAAGPINSVDKWRAIGTGAAGVFQLFQSAAPTPVTGFTNYLRAFVTTPDAAPAAGSVYTLFQRIEGTYCQDLQFGAANTFSVALTFWVRSSLAGAFSGALQNSAQTRSFPFSFTINAANTWEKKTLILPADIAGAWLTTQGIGIGVYFDLGCGANGRGAASGWNNSTNYGVTGAVRFIATNAATFDLTGVQFEAGSVPTDYEQRLSPDMLRLCQREFCKSFVVATAPAQNLGTNTGESVAIAGRAGALVDYIPLAFPVTMRATPTLATYNPAAANGQARDESAAADCSAIGVVVLSERGGAINCTGNAGTTVGNLLGVHWTADARL